MDPFKDDYDTSSRALAADLKQLAKAIKSKRDEYPVLDTLAGAYPPISIAQMLNDLAASDVDGGTAMNAVQALTPLRKVSALQAFISKNPTFGALGSKFEWNPTIGTKRNIGLTALQTLGASDAAE